MEEMPLLQFGKDTTTTFNCGGKEVLRFESNGDIYVQGRLVENDKEVVDTFKMWIYQVAFPEKYL